MWSVTCEAMLHQRACISSTYAHRTPSATVRSATPSASATRMTPLAHVFFNPWCHASSRMAPCASPPSGSSGLHQTQGEESASRSEPPPLPAGETGGTGMSLAAQLYAGTNYMSISEAILKAREQGIEIYSFSQLYAKDRPPPIPLSEHEKRRRDRDVADIVQAGKRMGRREEGVRQNIEQLEALIGVINLHRMKASDWVLACDDLQLAAERIICLKACYPTADVSRIITQQPRILLHNPRDITADAEKVRTMLRAAPNPDAIIEAVPELMDPRALLRALSSLSSTFPGSDPVELLQREPGVLRSMGGESHMELEAEYGELSTVNM